MAKVTPDWTLPDPDNDFQDDIDTIREDNQIYLLMASAPGNDYMLPEWTTSVVGADKSKPDYIQLVKGSSIMRFTYTWDASDRATSIVWTYDRGLGDGLQTVNSATITPSYTAEDELSGATTA